MRILVDILIIENPVSLDLKWDPKKGIVFLSPFSISHRFFKINKSINPHPGRVLVTRFTRYFLYKFLPYDPTLRQKQREDALNKGAYLHLLKKKSIILIIS